ncbi:MAG: phytoene desaturase [Acidobacteria bacterium]|nr:phytoene desaturase [Acidobacteriota bacterium]
MTQRVGVIGAGLGGLSVAVCLAAKGYQVDVFERHNQVGGKASSYKRDGFIFDEGPSIVVMIWVYQDLFQRVGRNLSDYLDFKRLDPAFRIFYQNKYLDIPVDEKELLSVIETLSKYDAKAFKELLSQCDLFVKIFAKDFYQKMFSSLQDIIFSRLMPSALILPPLRNYMDDIKRRFSSELVRSLLIGFPIYAGLDPRNAPSSLFLIPWTIIREGVWYPKGGIHQIPLAIAKLAKELGVKIHLEKNVSAIEISNDLKVNGLVIDGLSEKYDIVVSNSDYLYTHQLLKGKEDWPNTIKLLQKENAQPSASFLTLELALSSTFPKLKHHNLLLNGDPTPSYHDIFDLGVLPKQTPIYINAPLRTDPPLAPAGKDNLFVVISVPPRGETKPDPLIYEEYAANLLHQIESFGFSGLESSLLFHNINTPLTFEQKFSAFRGSIYGLGPKHNILYGAFRPLNKSQEISGLYFVGGGVQPGAGMPMVVQSGKIVADLIAKKSKP